MTVYFIGAGPGDPELLTIKGRNIIAMADIIIYAGSLVNKAILNIASRNASIYDSSKMTLDEVLGIMDGAKGSNKIIARVHTGDPSLYGAIQEQISWCETNKVRHYTVPGVSSFCAGAAALDQELTLPSISQTVIITRASGRTEVPGKEDLKTLAKIGATIIIFLSVDKIESVVKKLLHGYRRATPAAVVHRASWPEEVIVKGSLNDIAEKVKVAGIRNQALIYVGDVLNKKGYKKSRLYDKTFTHSYRKPKCHPRPVLLSSPPRLAVIPAKAGIRGRGKLQRESIIMHMGLKKIAIITVNGEGKKIAERLKAGIPNADIFSYHDSVKDGVKIYIKNIFIKYDGLIFIAAVGITTRLISGFVKNKHEDPAVVSIDTAGRFAISLLSGHEGGANRLASIAAASIGAMPIITTGHETHKKFILGIGSRRGISPRNVKNAVAKALDKTGISLDDIRLAATIDLKKDENGIIEACREFSLPLIFISKDTIKQFNGNISSSNVVRRHIGVGGVCEPCALLAGRRSRLVLKKMANNGVTVAIAEEE